MVGGVWVVLKMTPPASPPLRCKLVPDGGGGRGGQEVSYIK